MPAMIASSRMTRLMNRVVDDGPGNPGTETADNPTSGARCRPFAQRHLPGRCSSGMASARSVFKCAAGWGAPNFEASPSHRQSTASGEAMGVAWGSSDGGTRPIVSTTGALVQKA